MATFMALMPAIFIMFLAQLGRRYRTFGLATNLTLAFGNLIVFLYGAVFLLLARRGGDALLRFNTLSISLADLNLSFLGITFTLIGGVAFLLMVPLVQRVLAFVLRIQPGDPVHTTALVYACYLVGLAVVQTPFLRAFSRQDAGLSIPQTELWGQALALTLLAFVGVGFGVKRSPRETFQRLKLTWPGAREVRTAVVAALGLIVLQTVLGALWMRVAPDSVEEINRLSKLLLGEFFNPWGALVLGLSAGISEELVFRGALQPRFGLLVTSGLFAMVHSQYLFSFALVIVFLLGLVLGIVRNRVNTTASILTHALYNTTLVLLAVYGIE